MFLCFPSDVCLLDEGVSQSCRQASPPSKEPEKCLTDGHRNPKVWFFSILHFLGQLLKQGLILECGFGWSVDIESSS